LRQEHQSKMSATTATDAFFAKKKKGKKKTFKAFNANKVDSSVVASTVHVDAPMTSKQSAAEEEASRNSVAAVAKPDDEVWDDPHEQSALSKVVTGVPGGAAVLDMKAMDVGSATNGIENDVAERLRIEDTRAQLAAAREGMEREAERIQKEKNEKEIAEKAKEMGKPRFGIQAESPDGGNGKYVPRHLRGGKDSMTGGSSLNSLEMSRRRMGGGMGNNFMARKNLDTEDENMFPDLAAAVAIPEKKEKQAFPKKSKSNPWGDQKSGSNKSQKEPTAKEGKAAITNESSAKDTTEKANEPSVTPNVEKSTITKKVEEPTTTGVSLPDVAAPTPGPTLASSASNTTPVVRKKKKKKDLSTFKAGS